MPSTWDTGLVQRAAYCSGCLSVCATALMVALVVLSTTSDLQGCDMVEFEHLNATCLREGFERQRQNRFWDFSFDICDSMANLAAIPPVMALGEVYGSRTASGKLMVPAFVAGTAVTALQLTYRAGTHTAVDWVSGPDWDLSDEQVQTLALSSFIATAQNIWLFAMDFLLEAIGMLCAAHLVYQHGIMPKGWAHLAVFGGFLGILSFFMEIGRFGSWMLMEAAGGLTMATLGFVIQPIWIVWLGCALPSAVSRAYGRAPLQESGRDVEMAGSAAAPSSM